MDRSASNITETATPNVRWYFKRKWVLILIVVTAPFSFVVLPLLWLSPKFSLKMKVAITFLTVAGCYLLSKGMIVLWKNLESQIKDLKSAGLIS